MEISIAAARMVRSFYLSKQGLRSKSNDCEKQWWILQREKLSNRLKDGCEARSDRTVQLFEGWLRSKERSFVRPVVRRMVAKQCAARMVGKQKILLVSISTIDLCNYVYKNSFWVLFILQLQRTLLLISSLFRL